MMKTTKALRLPVLASTALFVLLGSNLSLRAQQHPNLELGFHADKIYDSSDIDSINTFNGQLSVAIPIGQRYPVNGGMSYGFTLVYNSQPWIRENTGGVTAPDQFHVQPNPRLNAGLGWLLTPGRLIPPYPIDPFNQTPYWLYQSPDGAEHKFYNNLHRGDPVTANTWYTRDGSYLRMKDIGIYKEVEFPDGRIHRFQDTGANSSLRGRLVQMRDPFNNYVNVSYPNGGLEWRFADEHGRVQRIVFETTAAGRQVDYLVLSSFGGTTAIYDFEYTTRTIRRGCGHNDPSVGPTVEVDLLTAIHLPENAGSYTMPAASSYFTPGATGQCGTSGLLKQATVPTGGRVEWTYQPYIFPDGPGEHEWITGTTGVAQRKKYDFTTLQGIWEYSTELEQPPPTIPATEPKELINTVTDPDGHFTRYFYSVSKVAVPEPGGGTWDPWEYGMPFTRRGDSGQPAQQAGRFLSSQRFAVGGQLKRSEYVLWEQDRKPANDGHGSIFNANRRVKARRTVFHDDANRWIDVENSEFDGLGHYRTSRREGNWGPGQNPSDHRRSSTTIFNPLRGTYNWNNATNSPGTGHSFSMWPVGDEWILNTYTERSISENGVTARTQACFDPDTGFLTRRRVLKNATPLGDDLLSIYIPDTDGNLASERNYGGDGAGISPGSNLCTLAIPSGSAPYRVDHDHAYGRRRQSQPYNGSTPFTFKSLDLDIDQRTSLVKRSRDVTGLITDYQHDKVGRLLWIKPQIGHDAWEEFIYSSGSGSRWVKAITRPNGSTAAQLTENRFYFDGFGRVREEWRKLPGGVWSKQRTGYDAQGRVVGQTVWTNNLTNSSPSTLYKNFDAFGRVGRIEPPDGAQHRIDYLYGGLADTTQQVRIGTHRETNGTITESVVATEYDFDVHGRLWRVREDSAEHVVDAGESALVTTEYSYDVGGRLSQVSTSSPSGNQNRVFTYDRRGFLLSEKHPELGTSGNGTTTYSHYDSKGNVGRRWDGRFELHYDYDRAGRLTDIYEKISATERKPWKIWDYSPQNNGTDRSKGKLKTAYRYNYALLGPTLFTIEARDNFVYRGPGGRISGKAQFIKTEGPNGSRPTRHWNQGFVYDDLGNIVTQNYPECQHHPCFVQTASPRLSVSRTFQNDALTAVDGWASLSYHGNGTLASVAHTNGVTDTITQDPTGMGRPAQIATSGGSRNWNSGPYSYDGAGNVARMGSDWFLYDRVSRVVDSRVHDQPYDGGTVKTQSYTFDPFGNIRSKTTRIGNAPPSTVNYAVNATTNHLSVAGYDSAGNVTNWAGVSYEYDPFNMVTESHNEGRIYLYGPGDERIWTIDTTQTPWLERFTLRGLGNEVTSSFVLDASTLPEQWTIEQNNIHRGSQLLASTSNSGTRHYSLDHLGTPRLITDQNAVKLAQHTYYPFGEESTNPNQDTERHKFTGHERDFHGPGTGDDLDYMHARYCDPEMGRFLTVDPILGRPGNPQTWNRYAYVSGNPLNLIDPTGLVEIDGCTGTGDDIRCRGSIDSVGEDPGEPPPIEYFTVVYPYKYDPTNDPLTRIGRATSDFLFNYVASLYVQFTVTPDCVESGASGSPTICAPEEGQVQQGIMLVGPGRGLTPTNSPAIQLSTKIQRQMDARGWTQREIVEAMRSGESIRAVNKATGGPATRYVHPRSGKSVVVDDATADVVHVGGEGFKYGTQSGDLP